MDDPATAKNLSLSRRLELRGRLMFGEAMSTPAEAAVAVAEAHRGLRSIRWLLPLTIVVGLLWWRISGDVPWTYLVVAGAAQVGQWLTLTRALRANEAVLAANPRGASDLA